MSKHSFNIQDIYSVTGKVVVVTGGGTGLGKAIAAGFAENGAKVYISGRRKEVLEQAKGDIDGEVIAIQGDVSTKAGVQAIVDQIEAKEKVVDALVNCAGVSRPWKSPITEHNDADAVEKMMAAEEDDAFNYTNSINVNGVYFMTTALIPLLRKSENPSVVNIASIAGLMNQRTMGSLTYGVSKAGHLPQRSELEADILFRQAPFTSATFLQDDSIQMTGKPGEPHEYQLDFGAARAAKRSTMGRGGLPQEIVSPVLMLCSKGGMYTNDAVITVDGGRHMGAGINDGLRMPDDTYTH